MAFSKTKQTILDTALDLFSTNGFEATSTGQIADAVGIRKSSLYNHFKSKEDILDTLIDSLSEEYSQHSPLSGEQAHNEVKAFSVEIVIAQIQAQIRFLLHDEHISKVRKLMTIEQFRNPRIAGMQTQRVYTDVLNYNKKNIHAWVAQSVLLEGDIELMAAQLAFPISAWLNLCDREPERETEVMVLIERHIRQFFAVYAKR